MGVYGAYVLPLLTDLAMRSSVAAAERARWIPLAQGRVLEIGAGSGLNFAHYTARARTVYALEPSAELRRIARRRARRASVPIVFLAASAEAIPLSDASVDTVVTSWTLCTIPDATRAVREMARVLRGEGQLIFVEHGRAPDSRVQRWQNRLTPVWRRLAGGCHLNRAMDRLIQAGGFEIATMERSYVPGPRVMAYFYRGVATRSGVVRPAASREPPLMSR